MNAPMRWPSTGGAARRVLEETNRVAAPSAADRERITEALRARLGAVILPDGLVPAAGGAVAGANGSSAVSSSGTASSGSVVSSGNAVPVARANGSGSAARAGLGRDGWLIVVVSTGVVAGALGFVLGHGMAERERGAPIDEAEAVATASLRAPVLEPAPDSASSGSEPAGAGRSGGNAPGEGASTASEAAAETEGSRGRTFAHERAAPVRRRAPLERAERAAASERRGSPAPEARGLSFAEVLERLQRANVALRQGQAALALIQLAELDRGAGDVLREEREATRALSLCAIGDTAGARRVAAPLLSGMASSIYGPRLDASCAREDGAVQD
jgi:hypothetical protein